MDIKQQKLIGCVTVLVEKTFTLRLLSFALFLSILISQTWFICKVVGKLFLDIFDIIQYFYIQLKFYLAWFTLKNISLHKRMLHLAVLLLVIVLFRIKKDGSYNHTINVNWPVSSFNIILHAGAVCHPSILSM